jgi:hypothetical protein
MYFPYFCSGADPATAASVGIDILVRSSFRPERKQLTTNPPTLSATGEELRGVGEGDVRQAVLGRLADIFGDLFEGVVGNLSRGRWGVRAGEGNGVGKQ